MATELFIAAQTAVKVMLDFMALMAKDQGQSVVLGNLATTKYGTSTNILK